MKKENRELIETIDRYTDGLVFTMQMQEIIETLSAAKAPKKDGKGNSYADRFNHHMPLFEAMQTASRKAFKRAFGYQNQSPVRGSAWQTKKKKISFKKNNEEVANVYLTQTAGRKRLTFSGKSFILNLAENKQRY